MGRITVLENLSLDGVHQAPAHPDEDPRDGFAHGGWFGPYTDDVLMGLMAPGMAAGGALLFGRITYERFAAYWPRQTDNPFTPVLDAAHKYLASTTWSAPLTWQNTELVPGDAADWLADPATRPDEDLLVMGSGDLVRRLAARDLVDEYTLVLAPLLLGSGRRLFGAGPLTRLRLLDATPTTTGVVVCRYGREA